MDQFLQLLIAYFASYDVAPPEVQPTDLNREKSYLYDLPNKDDDPDFVFVFRAYWNRHASLVPKNIAVRHIQVLVRHREQKMAFEHLQKLYLFILKQTMFEENDDQDIIHYLNSTTWVIFDCQQGPIKIDIDEKGRHIWGLSFAVKTNLF